jgi:hypothetical protein
MLGRFVSLAVAAVVAVPAASFGIECATGEKKVQHGMAGDWVCTPIKGQTCGEGRKFSYRNRNTGFGVCEADPNAGVGGCGPGETKESKRGRDYCKPGPGSGGACAPGRKATPSHWDPSVIVCEKGAAPAGPGISCHSNERPYTPNNKSIKPFCEPVGGRCGSLRVSVKSEVPGHDRCIDR